MWNRKTAQSTIYKFVSANLRFSSDPEKLAAFLGVVGTGIHVNFQHSEISLDSQNLLMILWIIDDEII